MRVLKVLLIIGIILCSAFLLAQEKSKPNIVFILVDDLGWTDTGFSGSGYYETPYMDQLAQEGAICTQAYAAAAVCSPTRASILTGKYPAKIQLATHIPSMAKDWNMGVPPGNAEFTLHHPASRKQSGIPNRNYLPLEEITIAEVLKKEDYHTGYIGKWHLGYEGYHPIDQGFDWQMGVSNWGQPMSYYAPYKRETRGVTYKIESLQEGLQKGEYLTDRLGREAVGFIQRNKQKPFFLQLSFYSVHTPIQPPKDKIAYFEEKEKTENHQNASYAAMISKVDENIGKVLQTLKELELEENTIVVLYSDNGGLSGVTSNHPLRKGKGFAYEGGIRVPLVIKFPNKIKEGKIIDVPINSVDFLPTFCAVADVEVEEKQQIDGKNILPLLYNDKKGLDRSLYWHFPHYRGKNIMPYSIIRDGDWKLIKRYEGAAFELFNLKDDLSEKVDLALEMPDKVLELNKKLEEWVQNTGVKVPKLTPLKD